MGNAQGATVRELIASMESRMELLALQLQLLRFVSGPEDQGAGRQRGRLWLECARF